MKEHLCAILGFLPLVATAVTYDEWRVTKFTPAELADPSLSGPSADFDRDGRSNFGEFALDSNPKVQDLNAAFDAFVDEDGKWNIHFLRWKQHPKFLYIPQVTSTLNGLWFSGSTFLEEVSVIDRDAQSEWVTTRDRAETGLLSSRFIRLYIGTDFDGDGLPDQWELLNGLNMFDPNDATSDLDDDGLTAAQEFAGATDAFLKNPSPPTVTPPAAPSNFRVQTLSDGSRFFSWDDNSDNEDYFIIRDILPDGTVVELGRVGPGQTSFYLPAAK